jgi:endogenous inhibitor of DNA gyrase (YacG/DUF329 family)
MQDLGRWAAGDYRVPDAAKPENDEPEPEDVQ